jgi:hypothetical protein
MAISLFKPLIGRMGTDEINGRVGVVTLTLNVAGAPGKEQLWLV